MSHSPTPWSNFGPIIHHNGQHVAHVVCDEPNVDGNCGSDEQRANALFIVMAVNCHEDLVAALRYVTNAYVDYRRRHVLHHEATENCQSIKDAKAALDKCSERLSGSVCSKAQQSAGVPATAEAADSNPSHIKWQAVWQQKPHDSHSRMIHEFTASDDRDQAMDVAHLEIQRDYCCVTFTIHTLERLT